MKRPGTGKSAGRIKRRRALLVVLSALLLASGLVFALPDQTPTAEAAPQAPAQTCGFLEHKHGSSGCHFAIKKCPDGSWINHHNACPTTQPKPVKCTGGQHRHTSSVGNQSYCHGGSHSCSAGQHATSTTAHGHVSGCHSTTSPPHSCPSNQRAASTTAHGHVTCVAKPPAQCTPGPGEHKHTLFNNQVTCHGGSHSCSAGQHATSTTRSPAAGISLKQSLAPPSFPIGNEHRGVSSATRHNEMPSFQLGSRRVWSRCSLP